MEKKINLEIIEANLRKRGYLVHTVPDKNAAREAIKTMISTGTKIGFPGSVSIRELDLQGYFKKNQCEIFDIWENGQRQVRLNQLNAEVVLTSINAVTQNGLLVNLDGTGNRVASMCYGPSKVIAVVGMNKIVDNLEKGISRVKNVAAPLNYQRKKSNTPCSLTGKCHNCADIKAKQCRVMVIHEGRPRGIEEFHIILVKENLGF